jgi:ATP-dependent Clp protease ATP-binding subunit ClpC
MSEYMEKHSVSKLVGSPPGYVGYEEGGQLSEKVRRNPYSVVLLDEIEKAHPDVFNILLQILEDGRLTNSQGRVIDFRNTIIIMTSNVGARLIIEPKKLGFGLDTSTIDKKYEEMKGNVMGELKKTFRPEFINRVDEIIVFHPLEEEHIMKIVGIMIKELAKRLKENDIRIEVTAQVETMLVKKGFDKMYGARPLRRVIQSMLEDKLAEEMLEGNLKAGDDILIDLVGEEISFIKNESKIGV